MCLHFHSVTEPSKNHDSWVRVLCGSLRVRFGLGSCTFLTFGFSLVLDKTWVPVRFVLAGLVFFPISTFNFKKALRETQTLRIGCSKAEPNFFALPQTPFLGV